MSHHPLIRCGLAALLVLVAVALGAGGIVAGEADDSPGLQFLGLLLVLAGVTLAIRAVRRCRGRTTRTGRE